MSSIIYNADSAMMEYHRLHGTQRINFWRPSSQHPIRELKSGDFVFFYSRCFYGNRAIRGIVGYGTFVKAYYLSMSQMWKQFQQQNGYDTKEHWMEAVRKYAQTEHDKLQSLYIEDVLFFNEPILLSSLQNRINPNIESYVYTDKKEKVDGAYEILEEASRIGIDWWTAAMQTGCANSDKFEHDRLYAKVCEMHRKIQEFPYEGAEIRRNQKLAREYQKAHPGIKMLHGSLYEMIRIKEGRVDVYIPLAVRTRHIGVMKTAMGHLLLWKHLLSQQCEEHFIVHGLTQEDYGKELWEWIADPVVVLESM